MGSAFTVLLKSSSLKGAIVWPLNGGRSVMEKWSLKNTEFRAKGRVGTRRPSVGFEDHKTVYVTFRDPLNFELKKTKLDTVQKNHNN